MTAALLLQELAAAGVELGKAGERLKFTAPEGAMTPAILAALRLHKRDLLALLEGGDGPSVTVAVTARPQSAVTAAQAESEQYARARSCALHAPVPTVALVAWLRGQRLLPEPRPGSVRQRFLPKQTAPPYCLDLADCLERIGAGSGSAEDAARIAAWLPTASMCARAVHDHDRDRGVELLRELVCLEQELRAAGVPVVFPRRLTQAERDAIYKYPETPAAEPAGA